jgi:hypothetical protein
VLTCAGDGLLLLWQRPVRDTACVDEDDEPQADTDRQVSRSTTAPAANARSRLLRDDGVESRYDFVRDVLQRRFVTDAAAVAASASASSSSSASAAVAAAPAMSTAVASSAVDTAAVSQRRFSVDVSQSPSQAPQVHVRELESAPRRFLPPILRHYLLQARFHDAHRRQSRTVEPSTSESVDWNAVQAILAGANDDNDNDDDSDGDGGDGDGRDGGLGKTDRASSTAATTALAPDDVAALFGDVSDSDDGDGPRVAGQKRPLADATTAAAVVGAPATAPTTAESPAGNQRRDSRSRDSQPPPTRRTGTGTGKGTSSGAASGATRRMLQLRRHR